MVAENIEGSSLTVEGLSVSYGHVVAVRDISFSVEPGRALGLVGLNGAGKTTTLLALAGVITRSGLVRLGAEVVPPGSPLEARRMGIALAPEGRALFSTMTVEDNLLLGGYVRDRRRSSERHRRSLERVFELFPVLKDFRKRRAGDLSGGQQQMLSVGRALMAGPSVLMLDEPSFGLAPMIAEAIYSAMRSMLDDGLAVIVVEERPERALEFVDHVVVMERGSVRFESSAVGLSRAALMAEMTLVHS